ncbi:hypothetical protein LAWI1_G007780 [Lachnellula willkommii]|uniref:BTB domain-containing protein n=1 Tax=Lachnellula willkommii TaxID=215461 RepID=A0A559M0C2_9HELO|nr:hypothetical protein LAWI1_G007780 [Lachnellula willkommii]
MFVLRHQSKIIPVRVGPHAEEFPVHREILRKSEYFRRALDGEFKEASLQAIDLPEEDPSIFSFVVSYLYEDKFLPIKPVATVLVADPDKGKGKEINPEDIHSDTGDGTDTAGSASDERYVVLDTLENNSLFWPLDSKLLLEAAAEEINAVGDKSEHGSRDNEKNLAGIAPIVSAHHALWSQSGLHVGIVVSREDHHLLKIDFSRTMACLLLHSLFHETILLVRVRESEIADPVVEDRMSPEDLRTWSYAYSLSIDVYVCANRYLMQDFKAAISAFIINNFEIAGLDAAQPSVLQSCKTLHDGVSLMDPLLRKVFARVGFLQARLWKNFREEISVFYEENPKLVAIIMKEMIERREEDVKDDLPAMDRHIPPPPPPPFEEIHIVDGPRRYRR